MNRRTVRYFSFLTALALVLLALACTSVWRREFHGEAHVPAATIQGWTVIPRIVSQSEYEFRGVPVTPEAYSVSFQASLPRQEGEVIDLVIDSVHAQMQPSGESEMWIFPASNWVSYESISPKRLVKSYTYVREGGVLVWEEIPTTVNRIALTVYARTAPGTVGQASRVGTPGIDTVIAVSAYAPVEPVTFEVVAQDFRSQQPGYHKPSDDDKQ